MPKEAKPSVAERMMRLFEGHSKAHGTHGEPHQEPGEIKWAIKRTAETVREPVTLALWEQHLRGQRPLGVVPIRDDSTCLWGSIDVDEYDTDLLELVHEVQRRKLPLVPCRSKSGGLHLFLFLAEPQTAAAVQAALRDVAAGLGKAGSEIFPKQTQVLSEKGDVGNWMVMPYFGGTFGGKLREQVGVKKTGAEQTIEEFLRDAERSRLTAAEFGEITARSHAPGRRGRPRGNGGGGDFSDGPPCLQHLAAHGFPDGSHNNALLMIGIYLKRASPADWQQKLDEANHKYGLRQKPEEVASLIRQLEKKDYEYTCKAVPMVNFCDSVACRTRRYGVGREGEYPLISSISKLDVEPAIWFVDVDGNRVELSTQELQQYALFHRACMERTQRCYRTMRQGDWLALLGEVMARHVEVIEAPPDASTGGRFSELVEEFLTNRARGERREDILSGRPWEDVENQRHYFRLGDLQRYLYRENMRDVTRGQITRRLETMGGSHDFFNLKGKGVRVWWVPSEAVVATPPLDTPPQKEQVI